MSNQAISPGFLMLLFVDMLSIYLIASFLNNDCPLTFVSIVELTVSYSSLSFQRAKNWRTKWRNLRRSTTLCKFCQPSPSLEQKRSVHSSINVFFQMKLFFDKSSFCLSCSRYLVVTQRLSYKSYERVGVLRLSRRQSLCHATPFCNSFKDTRVLRDHWIHFCEIVEPVCWFVTQRLSHNIY